MKVTTIIVRVLQLLVLLVLVVYIALVGYANQNTVLLPLLLPLHVEWVIVSSLLLGFVVGWLSLSGRVFRLRRQNRALHQRLIKAGLEAEPVSEPARQERLGTPSR